LRSSSLSAFSIPLALIWSARACTPHGSEDYGILAAMFLGVITVPLCFVATLVAVFFTVRHVRKDDE
jgi:hypothetical protein